MARDYGKIFTRAWGDPAFRGLSGSAQNLYMKLVSQPDTTMAGVLTTAPPRWAGQTGDYTPADVAAALEELEAARFVVTDPETMETLVRSFVRNDLGWRSPKTMIGIDSAIRAVLSVRLKRVIAAELARCDTSTVSDAVSDRTGKSSREVVEGLIAALRRDFPDTPSDPGKHDRDTPSDTPSQGVGDGVHRGSLTATATATTTATAPTTAPTDDPAPTLLQVTPADGGDARPSRAFVYPDEFERFWAPYPLKEDKRKALAAWRRAVREVPNATLIAAAERYRDDPNRDDRYTKLATSWLNAAAWENGPRPPRGGPGGGRPDALAQGLDTVARLRAQREAHTTTPQLEARRTA